MLQNKTLPTIPSGSQTCHKLSSTLLTINIYMDNLKKQNKKKNNPILLQSCCCSQRFPHLQKRACAGKLNWLAHRNVVATSKNKSYFMVLTALLRLTAERSADVEVEEINRSWRVEEPTWKHYPAGTLDIHIYIYMFACVFHTQESNPWCPSPHTYTIQTACVCISVLLFLFSISWEKNAFQRQKFA